MKMQILENICYGIEPMGWHPKQKDDDTWLCLDADTTGELRSSGGLYEFVIDFDKSKRSFNQAEVFRYMRKPKFGGIKLSSHHFNDD